jgi:hypothetical protein
MRTSFWGKEMMPIQLCLFIGLSFFIFGCTGRPELIEQKCSGCHKTNVVYKEKRPKEEWERLVHGMKARGLKVTPDEEKAILEILSKQYGLK